MPFPKIPKTLSFLIIVFVVAVLAYSLWVVFSSGAAEKGVVTCPSPDNCFWSAHFHVFMPIEVCGEKYRLPVEIGPLEGLHTHEEENIIHWHDRLPYDNKTKTILDTSSLRIGKFFDAVNLGFDSTTFGANKNGGLCNGKPGTLKMLVNGKNSGLFRDYVIHDKDVVLLVFDSGTVQEVEAFYAGNPIVFPALGRG